LNIARDAILTGPEAEFLSVKKTAPQGMVMQNFISFLRDAHQRWKWPSWMR